jgi:hypothetical protein
MSNLVVVAFCNFVMRNLLQFRDDAEARDDVVAKGYALLCAAYPRSD